MLVQAAVGEAGTSPQQGLSPQGSLQTSPLSGQGQLAVGAATPAAPAPQTAPVDLLQRLSFMAPSSRPEPGQARLAHLQLQSCFYETRLCLERDSCLRHSTCTADGSRGPAAAPQLHGAQLSPRA